MQPILRRAAAVSIYYSFSSAGATARDEASMRAGDRNYDDCVRVRRRLGDEKRRKKSRERESGVAKGRVSTAGARPRIGSPGIYGG